MSGTDQAYGATSLVASSDTAQVSPYARAMHCPVQTWRTVLPADACGTRCAVLTKRMVLRSTRTGALRSSVSSAICLQACYEMS
eukprot:3281264-Rhodomonas_salina.1